MDTFMMDAQLLLDWLKSDDSAIQLEALDQLCNMILFCDNVDRLFEQLSPRLFIPALANLFVKYKKLDDKKAALLSNPEGKDTKDSQSTSSTTMDDGSEEAKNAKVIEQLLKDSEADQQKFSVLEYSARALTHFFDAHATCSKRLVLVVGALSAMSNYISTADLSDRLQKDLAEQLVKAFEFISSREPDELYKAGALKSILKLIKKGRSEDGGRSKLFSDTVTSAMNIVNRLVTKFRPSKKETTTKDEQTEDDVEDIILLADLALYNPSKIPVSPASAAFTQF